MVTKKTYKKVSKKKNIFSNSLTFRRPKKRTYKKRNVFLQNQGFIKSFTMKNGRNSEKGLQWNSNYDGKKADMDLWMNQNGKSKKIHIEMSQPEIEQLLTHPSIGESLEKRLVRDFPL